MSDTLLLNPETWDLLIDSNGSIALASDPWSLAQDVASSVRTFEGECWYNTDKGIPYFEEILGHFPPMSLIRKRMEDEAETVDGVITARATITNLIDRNLTGAIEFIDATGQANNVNI